MNTTKKRTRYISFTYEGKAYRSISECCRDLGISRPNFYKYRSLHLDLPIQSQLDAFRYECDAKPAQPSPIHTSGPVVYGGKEYEDIQAFAFAYDLPALTLRAYARKRRHLSFEQVVLDFYIARAATKGGRGAAPLWVYRGVSYGDLREFCARAHWSYKPFVRYRYAPSRVHLSFAEVVDQYVAEGNPLSLDRA